MILNFFKDNFLVLFLIIGAFILLSKNMGRNKKQIRLFRGILGTSLFLTIFSYLGNVSNNDIIRTISLVISFSLKPVIILFFACCIHDTYNKKMKWLLILAGINGIICFVNLFYPIIFSIENGVLVKESLYYSSLICSSIYILIIMLMLFKKANYSRMNEIIILILEIVFIIGAILLEEFYNENNLVNLTILISAMFYYFYMRSSIVERDLDTNLLNKLAFVEDGEKFDPCVKAVISVGLNNLSEINKNKGFVAGNRALRTVAKHLAKYENKDIISYRVSSSEFAIYFLDIKDIDLLLFMKKLYKEILKCRYVISIECAYNDDSNKSASELYEIAFNKMINERNNYYELMNKKK